MDPRHLFADERFSGSCVFCGAVPESRDHCPSKVLLDEPFPSNLPVVDACTACNNSFSNDELYLACLIEAVISGSTSPELVSRANIRRLFAENPAIAARIGKSRRVSPSSEILWDLETERVQRVVLKLARGHIAYELSLPRTEEPESISFAPLITMTADQRAAFESPEQSCFAPWPEIGSRAFIRASQLFGPGSPSTQWVVVQPGRYRYLVGQSEDFVHMVLSEYLACRVVWN